MKKKTLPKLLFLFTSVLGSFISMAQNPGGISTMPAVWYKPENVSATSWTDASSNGLNLKATGSPTVNTGNAAHNYNSWTTGYSSSNYFNYIDPNASNPDLEVNPVFGNYNVNGYSYMALTVFGVARDTLSSGSGLITGIDNEQPNASEPGFGVYAGQQRFYRFSYGAGVSGVTAPVDASGVYVWRTPTGGSTASGIDTLLFGLNGSYNTTNLINKVSSVVGPYLKIGYSASDWGVFPGDIQEVIWYKDSLGYSDIQKVETYLALKFGTTLSHDYISPAGTELYSLDANSGYTSNVAGIGHDAANGNLDQRQSNSINAGKQVLIGTTGLGENNTTNTTGLADGQYLIWGDNGLAKIPSVAVSNITGTNFRFGSVWKVSNIGSVGTVRIAWPAQYAVIKLVQSNDPSFATGNTVTDMTSNTQVIGGITYNYADVTLADGQYFTFAAFVQAPGGVPVPAVWLKADAGIDTVTGHLNQWQNFGTSGGFAQQLVSGATTYDAPYYKQNIHNFNPSLVDSVTNANGGLELKNVFPAYAQRALSTFVLQDQPDVTQQRTMVSFVNNDNFAASADLPWFAEQNATQLYFWWDGSYAVAPSLPNGLTRYNNISTINSYHKAVWTTNPDTTFLGMNGAEKIYAIGNSSAGVGIGQHLLINADGGNNNPSGGNISEVIVYDRNLTDTERLRVNSYMAIKYGITLHNEAGTNATDYLSSSSQVVWDTAANVNYNNNIAGIAYDYNSGLDQKQSISVNTGAQVLIATTGLSNTNESNSTSLSDGQYLICGDNGLAKAPSVYTGNTFSAVNVRFGAIWKVQNTGSVGKVRIAWPAGLNNLSLIQSSNETFDASDVVTNMSANTQTVNGVTYNYADVTLSDGSYFTFAVKMEHAPGGVFNGLSEWFRADKQTTIAGGIDTTLTYWTDYAVGVTASQISTATLPKLHSGSNTYFNFNPGINFTGTDQKLGNLDIRTLSSLNYDIFSLTKDGLSGSRFFNIGRNNTTMDGTNWDSPGLYADGSVARRDSAGNLYINGGAGPTFASNTPNIMYYNFSNTSYSKGLNGAVNGTVQTHNPIGVVTGGIIFGNNSGTGTSGDDGGIVGNIGELIVYGAGNVTSGEKNRVDAYLAIKYGITLDKNESYLTSDSTVVWDKTDNAAYYNNIAGIARDDISALNQKQSRSQITNNPNGEIAIGLDTIAADNATNTNSFIADQTWFVWGDNGLTANLDAASVPFSYTNGSGVRMTRIWKAVNTSLTQTVELQFPQPSISAATGMHYVLLIADDENFTANVSVKDLTAGGNNYTVNFKPQSGTFYFTFARLDNVTPVGLENVSINVVNCDAVLSWTGATETNFSYYQVESSTDGTVFNPEQKIEGTGSGSHYTASIALSAPKEYIRLKMVDKDGSSRYSDIYTAAGNCGASSEPVVYPNPASNVLNIANLGSVRKNIQIFAANGAAVYKGQATTDKATINIKGWAPGIYMISVTTEKGKSYSYKVIIK